MLSLWWKDVGRLLYVGASELLILCDAGGSNGYRVRGWKYELQTLLATTFGLEVSICHYPPATSKWNPIEHRLFSFISINWAGVPLTSMETVLGYINSTTTQNGLTVVATAIEKPYFTGIKYSNAQMATVKIKPASMLPLWTYTLLPSLPTT
jgi:hypothetical protein